MCGGVTGSNAWSPESNNLNQALVVDLRKRYELRAMAMQGRRSPPGHVTEYMLQYSDDGEGWRTYSTQAGEEEVFVNIL